MSYRANFFRLMRFATSRYFGTRISILRRPPLELLLFRTSRRSSRRPRDRTRNCDPWDAWYGKERQNRDRRGSGTSKREKKGEKGEEWGRGRASGLGVQLGADVTAIRRYRRPRDRFFFLTALPPRSRKHRRIECMDGVIRTNVITACFASM